MGTPFEKVYDTFFSQIKDYQLAQMEETMLLENLYSWLEGAIPYFTSCKQDIENHDKLAQTFLVDLTLSEQVILAKYMLLRYISTFLMREENLSQSLNSKDYRMYSPANQLKALQSLTTDIKNEANTLQSQYSWRVASIKELFK